MEPRTVECFDLDWRFRSGDVPGAEARAYPDAAWRLLDLPHDWSIEGPFTRGQPSGGDGGYAPCGIGWYRKSFSLRDGSPRGRVCIRFDGVYMSSRVWVDGKLVGGHAYGYTSFGVDITDAVSGDTEPHVVAVRVDNSAQPGSRWYTGSGIYRHTWLVCMGSLHFADYGIFVTSPVAGREAAQIDVRARVCGYREARAHVELRTMLLDGQGLRVGEAESPLEVAAGAEAEALQSIAVERPRLWSPDSPSLYRAICEIGEGKSTVDHIELPFGIRGMAFDPDRGFLLNGERVKIRGVCLHHDGGCVGAAVPEGVLRRRLRLLKEMGCNAIRMSHNPPSPEMLEMCDAMGILVMDEAFDEWRIGKQKCGDARFGYHVFFDTDAEADLRAMVRRDRNHPSIFLWSIGNEIPEQDTPEGGELARRLAEIVHEEDGTRPVTSACDHISAEPIPTTPAFLEALDVVGYNYVDRWRLRAETYYEDDRARFPLRRMIGSENIALGGTRSEIAEDSPFPPSAIGVPFAGRMVLAEQLLRVTETRDYVAGDFMWTGIDYLGESRWPRRVATCGVLDTCGFAKDGYYLYQSVWTGKPVLHLCPHWNQRETGRIVQVTCFTSCDEVELFLNGRSLGRKYQAFPRRGMSESYPHYDARFVHPTTADLHLSWDVPFEPGALSAVGYRQGEPCCRALVRTTGPAAAVLVEPDRSTLRADRRDVCHVTLRIADAEGDTVPTADNVVRLGIEGEARLLGFDNGRPDDHTDYRSGERAAFHGLCMAVVQATAGRGRVRITAASAGLAAGACELTAEA